MKRNNFIVKRKRKVITIKSVFIATLIGASCFLYTSKNTVHRAIASIAVKKQKTVAPIAEVAASAPVTTLSTAVRQDDFVELEKRFQVKQILGVESLVREKNSNAIRITLNSDVFFQLGTAKIEEGSKDSIQQIITILKPLSSMSHIEIEGHTDDSPVIHQKPNYPSNWELSAARAASFIPLFENSGFFKDQLKVVGYGDSHPLFSNHKTPKISAKNRRIVLKIYAQEDERKI